MLLNKRKSNRSTIVNIVILRSWQNTAGQRKNDDTEEQPFTKFQTVNDAIENLQREMKYLKAEVANMSKPAFDDLMHLWDDTDGPRNGFREKQLFNPEGFSTHNETTLVDSPCDADLVVWVTVRGRMEASYHLDLNPTS